MGGRPPSLAQSSPAKPHQEGVTETSVSVEMGASKTVPPASTREETSSLQSPKATTGQFRNFDKCVLGNLAFNGHLRAVQMMTWEEIADLLITFGEKVHVIRGDNADAVSLQLVPAGWFVSIKSSGVLNMGTYEGKENRLVGTRTIPFAELKPEFLRHEVHKVMAAQVAAFLDSDSLRDYLDLTERKPRRRF